MADSSPPVLLEIAVDDIEGAVAAVDAGADRLELCAALELGGLTPSPGTLRAVKALVSVPVFAMVRPRAGDFVYSDRERAAMCDDIAALRAAGADGLVFGALDADGKVEVAINLALCAAAAPLPVTFHRAFDIATDRAQALAHLIELGCTRVLTAGGAASAAQGARALRTLITNAAGRITVVAGGGLRHDNVREVLASGVHEVHAGPRRLARARAGNDPFGTHTTTDRDAVARLAQALR
jgi:copper homeostasis protein